MARLLDPVGDCGRVVAFGAMGELDIRSPRIERLANDIAAGDASALDVFWREVEAFGASREQDR